MIPGTALMPGFLTVIGEYIKFTYADTNDDDIGTSITMPSDIQSGDIILVSQYVANRNGSAISSASGSGFTQLVTKAQTHIISAETTTEYYARGELSYKIADGTEGGTSIGGFMTGDVGFPSAFSNNRTVFIFRPDQTIGTLNVIETEAFSSATSLPTDFALQAGGSQNACISFVLADTYTGSGESVSVTGATLSASSDNSYVFAQIPVANDIDVQWTSDGGGFCNISIGAIFEVF